MDYYRLSGAGNDFLALAEPRRTPSTAEIRAWCRRGLSLGADGLFVLSRQGAGVRMVHYNADGGRAELCVNGSRCAARLAFELGWGDGREVELRTDAGILRARCRRVAGRDDRRIEIELPPIVGAAEWTTLDAGGARSCKIEVGVPHLVLVWQESLARAPVAELGARLRADPELGPAGANVDFVRFLSPRRLEIRTFERGVEAETLACGSGVVAAAAVGVAAGWLEMPATVLTAGGFELEVDGEVDGGLRRISLTGDARLLARGEILPGAGALPPPPAWSEVE